MGLDSYIRKTLVSEFQESYNKYFEYEEMIHWRSYRELHNWIKSKFSYLNKDLDNLNIKLTSEDLRELRIFYKSNLEEGVYQDDLMMLSYCILESEDDKDYVYYYSSCV